MRQYLIITFFMACKLLAGEPVNVATVANEDKTYWYTIEIRESDTLDLVEIGDKLKRVYRVDRDAMIVLQVLDEKFTLEKLIVLRDKILTLSPNERVFIKCRDLVFSVKNSKLTLNADRKNIR